jgi:hypothetical protein
LAASEAVAEAGACAKKLTTIRLSMQINSKFTIYPVAKTAFYSEKN